MLHPLWLGGITIRHRQEFLIDRSGDVGHHPRPKHLGFPLNLQSCESEIVDAVFQSEKPIRGEAVESYNSAISARLSFLTIRDDFWTQTIRGCLQSLRIRNGEEGIIVLTEGDPLAEKFLFHEGMTIDVVGGVKREKRCHPHDHGAENFIA